MKMTMTDLLNRRIIINLESNCSVSRVRICRNPRSEQIGTNYKILSVGHPGMYTFLLCLLYWKPWSQKALTIQEVQILLGFPGFIMNDGLAFLSHSGPNNQSLQEREEGDLILGHEAVDSCPFSYLNQLNQPT